MFGILHIRNSNLQPSLGRVASDLDYTHTLKKLLNAFTKFMFPVSCQNDITDGDSCDPKAIEHCVKLADPLVKEPKNIFPTTVEEVEQVCK